MAIQKDQVVSFHYTLHDLSVGDEPEFVESSRDGDEAPAILLGHNQMLEKVEAALIGREVGDRFELELEAVDGYGEYQEGQVQRVPIKHLMSKGKLKAGMVVTVNTHQGPRNATILKVGKFNVDLDTNHPLAGRRLRFDVEIVDARDASDEEKAHGHAHGAGGHQH